MAATAVGEGFTRELSASRASAGLVRSLVVSHLLKWSLPHVVDSAVTVISELVNNAVRVSSPADSILVHASLHGSAVWVGVADCSPYLPAKRATPETLTDVDSREDEDFGGWGLRIIEACSDRVWIERTDDGRKWVCAEIRWRDSNGPDRG